MSFNIHRPLMAGLFTIVLLTLVQFFLTGLAQSHTAPALPPVAAAAEVPVQTHHEGNGRAHFADFRSY